ncbi:MAG: hypothetical protein CL608_28870 [Anaerolineaceae bacterium]|nr:hypothetical protein [Anaerolineaceae bacterium]
MLDSKPLAQITQEAIQILYEKLGIVDTVRFLNQFTIGYGDYTAERDALFADITLDDILTNIKRKRKQEENRLLIDLDNQS